MKEISRVTGPAKALNAANRIVYGVKVVNRKIIFEGTQCHADVFASG
jgi:hypothetical protein